MLTAVHIYRSETEHFDLTIGGAGSFKITNIDGLDPVPAVYNNVNLGDVGRANYGYGAIGTRTIKFHIALEPAWAAGVRVQELRNLLYSYFPVETLLSLRFFDSVLGEVKIEGKVEEISPIIFTDEPTVQVSVLCAKSQFESVTETVIANLPLTASGDYRESTIAYEGTAQTGFRYEVATPSGPVDYISAPGISLGYAPDLQAGQKALFSTVWDDRYLKYNTTGSTIVDYSDEAYFFSEREDHFLPGSNLVRFLVYIGSTVPNFTVQNVRWFNKYSSL